MAITFSPAWLELLSDPYALLGASLSADDQTLSKQYRQLAKRLHPDRYAQADPQQQEFVGQLVARLLNPAYSAIKQPKDRAEQLVVMRLQAQQLGNSWQPTSEVARMLQQQLIAGAEIFYEQQVAQLADQQYESFTQFGNITHQLHELNLVYLIRKIGQAAQGASVQDLVRKAAPTTSKPMGQPMGQPTGNHPAVPTATPQTRTAPPLNAVPTNEPVEPIDNDRVLKEAYAKRHAERAQQYLEKGAYDRAVQEMKDALRMVADKAEYHALLSYSYFLQDLSGMAAVYCRQALKLNPDDPLANKMAKRLKLNAKEPPKSAAPVSKRHGLANFFRR
jgi:DnaJ-domain-containing protein 1